jgi:hypothetical protein
MTGLPWTCGIVLAQASSVPGNVEWFGIASLVTAVAALVTAIGGFRRVAAGQVATHEKLEQVVQQVNGHLAAAVKEAVGKAVDQAIRAERAEVARRIQASGGGKDPGP